MTDCQSCRDDHGPCPRCGERNWGCNPNRPNGPWMRCYSCWGLWDVTSKDLVADNPEFAKRPR